MPIDLFQPGVPKQMGNTGMSNDTPEITPHERMIELRLPSKLGYERVAMDAAASIAQRMGFDGDRVAALKTAVSEAVTNAIEHGNQYDEAMKVVVLLTVRGDDLVISVTDEGSKVIDVSGGLKLPDISQKLQAPDKGGWGMWLIRQLVDEAEFTTAPSGGNQVRMVIHLEQ